MLVNSNLNLKLKFYLTSRLTLIRVILETLCTEDNETQFTSTLYKVHRFKSYIYTDIMLQQK